MEKSSLMLEELIIEGACYYFLSHEFKHKPLELSEVKLESSKFEVELEGSHRPLKNFHS